MPILTRRLLPTLLRLKDAAPDPRIRVLRTTLNGNPEPHAHEARVTKEGFGLTSIDRGHFHRVADGVVEKVWDHDHKLIAYKHVRQIGLRASQFHPGAEVESPPQARRPSGVGGAGAGGPPPQIPAPGGGGAPPSGEVAAPPPDIFASRFIPGPILAEDASLSKFAVLGQVIRENDSVLDVGCGSGGLYDWLMSVHRKPVSYFGVDTDETLLREFRERRPEVGNRTGTLEIVRSDLFEDAHFNVATCFGLPSTFGCGPDRAARLNGVIQTMKSLADIIVVECLDNLYVPMSMENASYGVAEVKKLIGEWRHTVVRPLTQQDFAIVAYRDGIL